MSYDLIWPTYQRGDVTLVNGDSREVMTLIAPGSVDLTVTSPPYDNLRTYAGTNDWGWQVFTEIANELWRVTSDGGVVVWNVGDATINGSETGSSFRQALYFKDIGFNLHDTMIWAKPNPVPTQHTRYQNAFEYMFVLSKGAPKAINLLREPSKCAGQVKKKHRAVGGGHDDNDEGVYTTKDTKLRSNWWVIATGASPNAKHPAAFPEALARDHILSWSNPGDTVFDPFLGSGTTAKMAAQEGRKFIGIERVEDYYEIAVQRITERTDSIMRQSSTCV